MARKGPSNLVPHSLVLSIESLILSTAEVIPVRYSQKGFKLVELVIVGAVLLVITALAIPKFNYSRNREREAEVKSNIHAIQIACERYSVDSGGLYPLFLVGAERDSNILRSYADLNGNGVSRFPVNGMTPFAKVGNRWRAIPSSPDPQTLMDPLILFGYLDKYPANPFAKSETHGFAALVSNREGTSPGIFPYGGIRGDIMFDLSFGWGDTPQTEFFALGDESNDPNAIDPALDAPGNFYYHPLFADLQPVYMHYAAAYEVAELGRNPADFESFGIRAHEPDGYEIYGYGMSSRARGTRLGGIDVFDRMPAKDDLASLPQGIRTILDDMILDSSVVPVGGPQERVETTGYSSDEDDPWTGRKSETNPSDGPDQVIIGVSSGNSGVSTEAYKFMK